MKKITNFSQEISLLSRSGLGMGIFLLHRLTGLALVFYLFLHIIVISTSLKGPKPFDQLLAILTSPFFLGLDLGLLAAILFHGFNGIRILLFDLGVGIRWQKFIFLVLMIPAVIIGVITFYLTLPHILK